MRVEHYRKTDLGWEMESLTQADEILRFDALAFEHRCLNSVYFGVELTNVHRLAGLMDTTATFTACSDRPPAHPEAARDASCCGCRRG